MLKVINLYVIQQIFLNCEMKLKPSTQMIYINCLMHHFSTKKPVENEATQFEIFKSEFPSFKKFQADLEALHKANLILIDQDKIVFYNTWGQHIDKTQLGLTPVDYEGESHFHSASKFEQDLRNNSSMKEFLKMRHKVDDKKYQELITTFISEQVAILKKYTAYSECLKHFSYWIKYNVTPPTNQQVISTMKRLGD